jgi:hypothetical protein
MSDVLNYISSKIPNEENKLRIIFNHSCSNLPSVYHIKTALRYEMLKKIMETPRTPLNPDKTYAVLHMATPKKKKFHILNVEDNSESAIQLSFSVFTELSDLFKIIKTHKFPGGENFIVTNNEHEQLDEHLDVFDYFSFFSNDTKDGVIFVGSQEKIEQYFTDTLKKKLTFAEPIKCSHTGPVPSIEEVSSFSGKEYNKTITTRCKLKQRIDQVQELMKYIVAHGERPPKLFEEFTEKNNWTVSPIAEIVPHIFEYTKREKTDKEKAIQADIDSYNKSSRLFLKIAKEELAMTKYLAEQAKLAASGGLGGGKRKTRKHKLKKNKRLQKTRRL